MFRTQLFSGRQLTDSFVKHVQEAGHEVGDESLLEIAGVGFDRCPEEGVRRVHHCPETIVRYENIRRGTKRMRRKGMPKVVRYESAAAEDLRQFLEEYNRGFFGLTCRIRHNFRGHLLITDVQPTFAINCPYQLVDRSESYKHFLDSERWEEVSETVESSP